MPTLRGSVTDTDIHVVTARHESLGKTHLYCLQSPPPVGADGVFTEGSDGVHPEMMFTENNTNYQRLYNGTNPTPYVKDAFHDHIIPSHSGFDHEKEISHQTESKANGRTTPVPTPASTPRARPRFINPEKKGTKAGAHYVFTDVPGHDGCCVVRLKLTPRSAAEDRTIEDETLFDDAVESRREEADEFYSSLVLGPISDDLKQIMRQALGGMMWSKQYYKFIQKEWIQGDPAQPAPPPERKHIRNKVSCTIDCSFGAITNENVIGMEAYARSRHSVHA